MLSDFDSATVSTPGPRIVVSTLAEFNKAVATLSAGTGGTIALTSDMELSQPTINGTGPRTGHIAVVAEDPDNPPTLAGVRLVNAQNIGFYGLEFDSQEFNRPAWLVDLMVTGGKNITFSGNSFAGGATEMLVDAAGRAEDGALIRGVDGLTFTDNLVTGYTYGVSMLDVANIEFARNEITKLQGDGLNGGGWRNVVIEDNWFHDMLGSTQEVSHSDFIQLWRTNVKTITDGLTIRGNVLDSGEGPAYQSIFMRVDATTPTSEYHRNILIEDNVIHNAMPNGIRLGGINGATVRDNTVLWNKASDTYISQTQIQSYLPSINVSGTGYIEIKGNIAPAVIASVDVSRNVIVTYGSPNEPNHVTAHFVNGLIGGSLSLADLELRPGSSWVGKYGAAITQPSSSSDDLEAVMMYGEVAGDADALVLDAGLSRDAGGYLTAGEAVYQWIVEGGTTLSGQQVTHVFEEAGLQDVRLRIITPTETTEIERKVLVRGSTIAEVDFDSPAEGYKVITGLLNPIVSGLTGKGFHLDGTSQVVFDRTDLDFHRLDTFTISLDLRKDAATGSGYVMDLVNAFHIEIQKNGVVKFQIQTDEGTFAVQSAAGAVADTKWHDIDVTYDGLGGGLNLYIDEVLVDLEADAGGSTAGRAYWGLILGSNAWRSSVKAVVDDFSMRAEVRTPGSGDDDGLPDPTPSPGGNDGDSGGLLHGDVELAFNGTDTDRFDLVSAGSSNYVTGLTGKGFSMKDDSAIAFSRNDDRFHGLDSFSLGIAVKKDALDGSGHIIHLPEAMELNLTPKGELRFQLETDEGTFLIKGGKVSDRDWHKVHVVYDDDANDLTVYLDGQEAASGHASGETQAGKYWGLRLGSYDWRESFDGVIDDFDLDDDTWTPSEIASDVVALGLASADEFSLA